MIVPSGTVAAIVCSGTDQATRPPRNITNTWLRSSSAFFSSSSLAWFMPFDQAYAESCALTAWRRVSTSDAVPLMKRETPPSNAPWSANSGQGKMSRIIGAGLMPRPRSCRGSSERDPRGRARARP